MKKVFLLMVTAVSMAFPQALTTIYSDTVKVVDSWIPVAAYAAGDIIRAKDTSFFSISTGTTLPSSGYIRAVIVETDTPNVSNTAFVVRFYNFNQTDTTGLAAGINADTTGFNVLQAVDNSPAVNNYHKFNKYLVGDVATTAQSYAGGASATGATSINMSANLPFTSPKGKLWINLLANGSYTPKKGGAYRIKVVFERFK